jgi:TonB family protein
MTLRHLLVLCLLLTSAAPASARPGDGQEIPAAGAVTPPVVVTEVKPFYPPDAMSEGKSGSVTLECTVNADGTVGDVRVTTPLDPALDDEAVKAARQWKFKPGMKDGKPVPVMVELEMSFAVETRGPRLGSPEVYKPGQDVTAPKAVSTPAPAYPPAATSARIQGSVTLECVVLPDGKVGHSRVAQSLHPQLDAEAMKALARWRFEPGMKDGRAVPVHVSVEMTFTLK